MQFDPESFLNGNPALAVILDVVEAGCKTNSESYLRFAGAASKAALPPSAVPLIKRYDTADPEPLTFFHSSTIPTFGLARVMEAVEGRFSSYTGVTSLQAVTLMLRFADRTGLGITSAMMHRLFVTALLVVGKAHHDCVPRTGDFAVAMGIRPRELVRLEASFMRALEWHALVTASDLEDFVARLALTSPRVRGSLHLRPFPADEDGGEDVPDHASLAMEHLQSASSSLDQLETEKSPFIADALLASSMTARQQLTIHAVSEADAAPAPA